MGYYTYYTLQIIKGNGELIKEFRNQNDSAQYAIDEYGNSNTQTKWYSSERDLIDFSLNHPDTLFKLSGEGEDSGDIWDLYVQNGKTQFCKAQIVIPPFDPTKLK